MKLEELYQAEEIIRHELDFLEANRKHSPKTLHKLFDEELTKREKLLEEVATVREAVRVPVSEEVSKYVREEKPPEEEVKPEEPIKPPEEETPIELISKER